jgi:hypothetical protein
VRVYGYVWRAFAGLFLAVGMMLACLALPANLLVVVIMLALLIGTTTGVTHSTCAQSAGTPVGAGRSAALGVLASAATLAVAGFAVILSVGVIGLVLVLGLGSPQALRWCGRRVRRSPQEKGGELLTRSTAELCRQWQATYSSLRDASTPAARLRIVEIRQRCLDELERRDPAGLSAWLASTASAGGDPSRYLNHTE